MLNPYTLTPQPEKYRADSTMAIAVQREQNNRWEKSYARKENFKNSLRKLFKGSFKASE